MVSIIALADAFKSEEGAVDYLLAQGVLEMPICCDSPMRLMKERPKMCQCSKWPCKLKKSLVQGTFFGNSKLKCNKILLLSYLWCTGSTHTAIVSQSGLNKNTVTDWWGYCQELVGSTLENRKIGGEGITIEIDESKFGKRKHHRGHRVEGVWVVGGVERTEERKMFVVAVPNRSARTLSRVINSQHPRSSGKSYYY